MCQYPFGRVHVYASSTTSSSLFSLSLFSQQVDKWMKDKSVYSVLCTMYSYINLFSVPSAWNRAAWAEPCCAGLISRFTPSCRTRNKTNFYGKRLMMEFIRFFCFRPTPSVQHRSTHQKRMSFDVVIIIIIIICRVLL